MASSLRTFRCGYRTLRAAGMGRIASALAAFRAAFGPEPRYGNWPEE